MRNSFGKTDRRSFAPAVLLPLCLLFAPQAKAELSAKAGQTLLENFSCNSANGSSVKGVQSSLNSLQSTLKKIQEQQKECQADLAGLGELPDIDAIVAQIDNHGLSEDIKKQERIIVEALNDLAVVRAIPLEDESTRALYPSEVRLQEMVAEARAELVKLRGTGFIEKGKADRQKYTAGIRQLDTLAKRLSATLQKDSKCFNKNPGLKKQFLSGLFGITGFFAATPAGIGITLAGRLMQDIFDAADSMAVKSSVDFDTSHQTLLVSGLSCTLETLASQHCKLLRQEELLKQLKNQPCQNRTCPKEIQDLVNLMRTGKSASEAVAAMTDNLGPKIDNQAVLAINSKVNDSFKTASAEFEAAIASAEESYKQAEVSKSSAQQQANFKTLRTSLIKYANAMYGNNREVDGQDLKDDPLQDMSTDAEKQVHILNLIFTDKELDDLVTSTVKVIESNPNYKSMAASVEDSGEESEETQANQTAKARNAAIKMLLRSVNEKSDPIPITAKVRERMKNKVVFERIRTRLAAHKAQVLGKTATLPADEKLGDFMMAFMQDDINRPSSLKNLENVQAFMDNIPPDFVKSWDPLLKISEVRKEVTDAVALGNELDSGAPMEKEKVADLMGRVGKMLDPSRGFKDRLAKINDSVASFQMQRINRMRPNLNPQDVTDYLFLQNKDFLESIYGMNLKDIYEKGSDTSFAKALSASQIDSFGKFFNDNLKPALNMLNKKDVSGSAFNTSLAENVDGSLKDHFCIQSLALTQIPDQLRKECQGTAIKIGDISLNYNDYDNDKVPHKERVCAYRNFLNRLDYESNKRKSGPSGTGNTSR